jgi:rod shape determining protein RodA
MPNTRGNLIANTDWVIVGIYFLLVIFGMLSIYSADYNTDISEFFNIDRRSGKQFLWAFFSIILGFGIMKIDSKIFQVLAYPTYFLVLGMQIFVILFAKEVNGAKAWLEIGAFKIQPAEFSKFATALCLSVYVSKLGFEDNKKHETITDLSKNIGNIIKGKGLLSLADIKFKTHIIPLTIITLPIIAILLQKDTGTAIVFVALSFTLFREGIIGNIMYVALAVIFVTILTLLYDGATSFVFIGYLAIFTYAFLIRNSTYGLLSVAALVLYIIIRIIFDWDIYFDMYAILAWILITGIQTLVIKDAWKRTEKLTLLLVFILTSLFIYSVDLLYKILLPHQRVRIDVLFGKIEDPSVAFQTEQSLNAIGSGGFFGKGFLNGDLTKGKWVPEQFTDYIFCTVGEEWGFLGAFIVVTLMIGLIIRIIQKAEKQRSRIGRVYGYCVAAILFFHFLVNIGITIQLMPVIGIPLPFFSYGGSSLLSFTVLLFIFLRFDSQRLDIL